jgi:hypothetical protein
MPGFVDFIVIHPVVLNTNAVRSEAKHCNDTQQRATCSVHQNHHQATLLQKVKTGTFCNVNGDSTVIYGYLLNMARLY